MKDSSPAAGEKEHRIYAAEIRGSSEKMIHGFFVNPPVMAEFLRNFLNNIGEFVMEESSPIVYKGLLVCKESPQCIAGCGFEKMLL